MARWQLWNSDAPQSCCGITGTGNDSPERCFQLLPPPEVISFGQSPSLGFLPSLPRSLGGLLRKWIVFMMKQMTPAFQQFISYSPLNCCPMVMTWQQSLGDFTVSDFAAEFICWFATILLSGLSLLSLKRGFLFFFLFQMWAEKTPYSVVSPNLPLAWRK